MSAALSKRHDFLHQKFNLKDYEIELLHYCHTKNINSVTSANYFIVPKALFNENQLIFIDSRCAYRLEKRECKFASCSLLDKHGLVIGSFEETAQMIGFNESYATYSAEFKNIILDAKLFWTTQFLKGIHFCLENHYATKHKEFVNMMISDVIVHIRAAEDYRSRAENIYAENVFQYQTMVMRELKLATQLLAKLHDGKSFLSRNIVEMMMVFEYFRDVYF